MNTSTKLIGTITVISLRVGAYYLGSKSKGVENDNAFAKADAEKKPIVLVQPDRSYSTVPLEKDTIVLKVAQTKLKSFI